MKLVTCHPKNLIYVTYGILEIFFSLKYYENQWAESFKWTLESKSILHLFDVQKTWIILKTLKKKRWNLIYLSLTSAAKVKLWILNENGLCAFGKYKIWYFNLFSSCFSCILAVIYINQ